MKVIISIQENPLENVVCEMAAICLSLNVSTNLVFFMVASLVLGQSCHWGPQCQWSNLEWNWSNLLTEKEKQTRCVLQNCLSYGFISIALLTHYQGSSYPTARQPRASKNTSQAATLSATCCHCITIKVVSTMTLMDVLPCVNTIDYKDQSRP